MGKGRAPCCEKVGLKRGSWTPAEDMRLVSYIAKHGHGNWRALPKQAGLLRCGKSCRLRWINYLRPDIKRGNFTDEEEDTITRLHQSLGNKWSKIASHLPGRTDNEIKNIWHTYLKKRLAPTAETGHSGTSPSASGASSTSRCSDQEAAVRTADNSNPRDSPPGGLVEIPATPDLDWTDMLAESLSSSSPNYHPPGVMMSRLRESSAPSSPSFNSSSAAPSVAAALFREEEIPMMAPRVQHSFLQVGGGIPSIVEPELWSVLEEDPSTALLFSPAVLLQQGPFADQRILCPTTTSTGGRAGGSDDHRWIEYLEKELELDLWGGNEEVHHHCPQPDHHHHRQQEEEQQQSRRAGVLGCR